MRDKLIKDSLLRLVGVLGMDVVKRTRAGEVRELIRSLHPVDSGAELIRMGPDGDGGYLLPDDLEGIEFCFSPGVSTESGFEAVPAEQRTDIFRSNDDGWNSQCDNIRAHVEG